MKQIKNDFEGSEYVLSQPQYNIANCDIEKLKKYKTKLRDRILNGQKEIEICDDSPYFLAKNRNIFYVEPLECGTGKSYTTQMAIIWKYSTGCQKGTLYFTKLIKDGKRIVEEINSAFKEDVAFALNSETTVGNIDIQQKLKKYPIIVATHKQYEILAHNKELRKRFMENRELLVIDEWFSLCSKKTLTLDYINNFKTLLIDKFSIQLFEVITKEIEDYLLKTDSKRHFFNAKTNIKEIKKNCNRLKAMIRENLNDDYLKRLQTNKKEMCQVIDDIVHFYNGTSIVQNYVMHTVDRTVDYWTLNNNIILDASASLNEAYNLRQDLFKVEPYESVLDYKKWEIINIFENSSKSGQDNYSNFFDIIKKIADSLGKDETLIVDKMENANKQYLSYHSSYYANLRSNNDYKDMKNLIIAYTPYLPDNDAVLDYLYFSKKSYCDKDNGKDYWWCEESDWAGRMNGTTYQLSNKDFEFYRKTQVANEIYQAIKRVNRDMSKETKVIFITKDLEVFNMVTAMLHNCKVTFNSEYSTKEYAFKYKKVPKNTDIEEKMQKETYVDKAINLFTKVLDRNIPSEILATDKNGNTIPNKYRKSTIGQYIRY